MTNAILPIHVPSLAQPRRESRAGAALLGATLVEMHAQGAYLYRIEAPGRVAILQSAAGLPVGGNNWALLPGVDDAAIVLQQNAWQDERFRSSDPFREHRFEGAVSVPIIEDGEAVAVLLVCRLGRTPIKATEFAFLQSLASALTAVSAQDAEMDELRRKVAELTNKLAVRKLVERAKGILQEQLQLTEEQAYLSMRRLSRRRGIPMGAIAEALIEDAGVREIRLEG